MQTYVHLAMGMALSQVLFPNNLWTFGATVFGSVGPDIYAAWVFKRHSFKKGKARSEFSNISKGTRRAQEIINSLPIWIGLMGKIASYFPITFPLFAGYISHLWVDLFTHNREDCREVDPTWVWPLPISLYGVFALVDYRDWGWYEKEGLRKNFDIPDVVATVFFLVLAGILWFAG
jgi:membrane-bound metal-dependent hydrolase YbcI (DUF457 family)